jgi:hypothetical protein
VTGPTPALAADLHAGLRRLKLAAMRTLAPELLVTAKTQRWAPEELHGWADSGSEEHS